MTRPHELLHELLTAQAASINNLGSYTAETYKGALLYVYRKIKEYEKQGLVRLIPFNIRPTHSRRQYLYQVTKKGAKLVGREEDYRFKDHQSYNAINHETMKYDVVLSFTRNFLDYNFRIEYEKTLKTSGKGIRADIYLVATKLDGTKQYSFLIETEHKDNIVNSFKEKVLPYDKAINEGLFKKNGLPEKTKVLFVCCCTHLSTFLRPQEYGNKENSRAFKVSYQQFDNLMSVVKQHFTTGYDDNKNPIISNKDFRFIPFTEFPYIAESIWRVPSGEKIKIMD